MRTAPSTSVSSWRPGVRPGWNAYARPDRRAAVSAAGDDDAAQSPVRNPLVSPRQSCPEWSSLAPFPVSQIARREKVSHRSRWTLNGTKPRSA